MTVIAPTTSATVAPPSPNGLNGWYVNAPTVTLTATAGDKPVASTTYSIDGGPNQTYAAPFQVATDGSHVISFFSTDTDGNTETAHQITVKVDLHDPTSSAQITPAIQNGWYASPTVTLTGNDGSGSGIDHISYKIDGEATWHTYSGAAVRLHDRQPLRPVPGDGRGRAGRGDGEPDRVQGRREEADGQRLDARRRPPTTSSNKVVTAKFKCADKESGMASCVGSTANGANLDTSTVGDHTLTVTGTDKAGNVRPS